MKTYIDDFRVIEKINLSKESIENCLPESLEQEELLKISQLLKDEGYTPESFYVCEYPASGIYIIENYQGSNRFTMAKESDGRITPNYTTQLPNDVRVNTFSCVTISEAIEKNEW